MNLLVDLGNSRLKWAQDASGQWQAGAALLDSEKNIVELFDKAWKKMAKPRRVVVCSVSHPERIAALGQWIRSRWSLPVHIVRPQAEQLGVKNLYRQPDQLGADRWTALIGARGLTHTAACVVDAGTALTVDAMSAKGDFLGGVIFPGLKLLHESLVQGTVAISAEIGEASNCLGRSTEDGVAAGTLFGLAGAVDRLIEENRRTLGDSMKVFLTGGDAPLISSHLRVAYTPSPDLVLKGLARIADSL
ncbi:MAG: type III pantothenate kinase [Gammaproteobacteria bacterium]|nr:type III pantothenate kinase [Gammaproteobacteria bacterium]MDH3370149.1 type III pantothenate kinase [Gammaproteobacteria bacterium]MDH3407061.1 type III pantothenate kinase [Gammaproteobacteria bacterium]MDH3562540.1 type III pantothenate kinase [Gammaproteobacteria bacterium]MDH5487350.1 type III pantothenate kinase [Gammaproteobacteria bacterium]